MSTVYIFFFLNQLMKVVPELQLKTHPKTPTPNPETPTKTKARARTLFRVAPELQSPKPQASKLKNKYNISICKVTD